jgi:negative regulator of sigma E activity
MTQEQLEFSITQYLDGTLPAGEIAALEARLAEDSEARGLLEQHRKLLGMLRADSGPAVAWDELAKDFSAVVTGTVDQEAKAADQKLNGLLRAAIAPVPEVRWEALAERISSAIDREAAVRDEQDEKLDEALRALPAPAVNWDRLAAHLSDAVAREEAVASKLRGKVFSIKWVRTVSQLAVAACLAVAAAVGIRAYLNRGPVTSGPKPVAVVEVGGPERSNATAVASIEIGPSAAYVTRLEDEEMFGRGVASARTPMVIALPAPVADEGDRGLMFE